MIILGIDPGTATMGYGIVEKISKKTSYKSHGAIVTDPKETAEKRLLKLYNELDKIIKREKPDAMAVEKLFFFKNLKTALPVSEARGIVLLLSAQKKIPLYQFTPLEVKMGICGYGRADKKQIQKMIKEIFHLEKVPKPDDAADALGVAICCSCVVK